MEPCQFNKDGSHKGLFMGYVPIGEELDYAKVPFMDQEGRICIMYKEPTLVERRMKAMETGAIQHIFASQWSRKKALKEMDEDPSDPIPEPEEATPVATPEIPTESVFETVEALPEAPLEIEEKPVEKKVETAVVSSDFRSVSIVCSTKMSIGDWTQIIGTILKDGIGIVFMDGKEYVINSSFKAFDVLNPDTVIGNVIHFNNELLICK